MNSDDFIEMPNDWFVEYEKRVRQDMRFVTYVAFMTGITVGVGICIILTVLGI